MENALVHLLVVLFYVAAGLGVLKAISTYISSFLARRRALSPQQALAQHFADSLGCEVQVSSDGTQMVLYRR